MFLSMNWIGDFVDLSGLDKKALIRNFTLSTAEVEDIYVKGEDTYGVIAAQIVSVTEHPNSKKLHLLKVYNGKENVDVVCGAPNVRVGMTVAFAPAGSSVQGHAITEATVAGYPSYGMCCSESEIGISDDHSGLWELDPEVAPGTDLKSIYDIDDIIFEVDNKSLTNRPDLWGHYGMAREFSTITGRALKVPDLADLSAFDGLSPVAVDVKATDLVWRYTALKVENVTRKVSPVNMRIRLYYCGSRAINFLADLTNYVMMELGQPMHAFDCAKVDAIEVRTFPEPFVFRTLDGVDRNIDERMLMITSHDVPVAIAGVMGGDASKIEDDTTALLLESATFDGVSVRKTTTRLGHRTDASMRYEKMLDPELCKTATARLLYILCEADAGVKVVSSFTDKYVKKYPTVTLNFTKQYIDRYTGIEISTETVIRTLSALGFGVKNEGDDFTVTVPSYRATKDVTIKADIIEEITRIYGYDNFDIHTSVSPLRPVRPEKKKSVSDRMKDLLVENYRMHEVHSYIWSDAAKNRELGIETPDNVRIINAQTPEHQYLRRSMIPTLLSFAKENKTYADTYALFEIGHTVEGKKANGYADEYKKLGAVIFSRTEGEENLFYRMRNAAADLCTSILHKSPVFEKCAPVYDFCHPENTFSISVGGVKVGYLAAAYPTVKAAIDKKGDVAFFEINTDLFATVEAQRISYKEPSKFPAIDIDINFLADVSALSFPILKEAAKEAAGELLVDMKLHDVYEGADGDAVTFRFSFLSADRTLQKAELTPLTEAITAKFESLGLKVKA